MRDIEFRGKNLYGRWIYGYYVKTESLYDKPCHLIYNGDFGYDGYGKGTAEEIKWETLGQFSNMYGKDGVKLFDGDVVLIPMIVTDSFNRDFEIKMKAVITFINGAFYAKHKGQVRTLLSSINHKCSVIGNVYDNPELMEDN